MEGLNEVTDILNWKFKYNNIAATDNILSRLNFEYPFTSPIPNEIYVCDSNFDDMLQDSNEDFF